MISAPNLKRTMRVHIAPDSRITFCIRLAIPGIYLIVGEEETEQKISEEWNKANDTLQRTLGPFCMGIVKIEDMTS